MVIPNKIHHRRAERGVLVELTVAMAILVIAMLPLAYSANSDARLFKATYQRALAMELVDGEMEILMAGPWRDVPEGAHPYSVHANAAVNLPPGKFLLTRAGQQLRLEWSSDKKSGIGPVVREVTIK